MRRSASAAPCRRLITGSLRLLVSVIIRGVPPRQRVVFQLGQRTKLAGTRVTRGLRVDGGAIRGRLGLTLGRLGGTLLFFVFLCLYWCN